MDANNWIPLAEQLPEDYKTVLVAYDGDLIQAYITPPNGLFWDPVACDTIYPTHWQPLPDYPPVPKTN